MTTAAVPTTMSPARRAAVTCFGLGRLRPFPGTWGSLPPVVLVGAFVLLGIGPAQAFALHVTVMLALVVLASLACVMFGDEAEAHFHAKDPSPVVADEVAGQALALVLLPPALFGTTALGLTTLALVFVAFRFFDIVKPPPAGPLQGLPGGWGILLDDLVAGVFAALLVMIAFAMSS